MGIRGSLESVRFTNVKNDSHYQWQIVRGELLEDFLNPSLLNLSFQLMNSISRSVIFCFQDLLALLGTASLVRNWIELGQNSSFVRYWLALR